jgi:hypothetical protein
MRLKPITTLFLFIFPFFILGCASSYDYKPTLGHPAHPDSRTVPLIEPADPANMDYPYSPDRKPAKPSMEMDHSSGTMPMGPSQEGGME